MDTKFRARVVAFSVCLLAGAATVSAAGATFGKVVPIGGQASDLALDENRGVLYIANFTANRVDVMSLTDGSIQTSINVPSQPSSLSVSPDGNYLLIGHYGNFSAPSSPTNGLTLIDLNSRARQTFALGAPVLGVAFGIDGRALVVTNTDYTLFDPVSGSTQALDTIANVNAQALPVMPGNAPPDITNASIAVSGDGRTIYGMGGSGGTFTFRYDVNSRRVGPGGIVLASGVLGPRVVSVNQDGSQVLAGWVMVDAAGNFTNFFKGRTNQFSVGSTAFDPSRGLIYAQMPEVMGESPVLKIVDSFNLAMIDKLKLAENLAGKSLLSSDSNTLYSVSDSGVTILPVGSLSTTPRLRAAQQDVVFRGSFCDRRGSAQQITIVDPSGGNTPFTITPSAAGVTVSPSSGVTPATVNVSVDPTVFANQNGTVAVTLSIASNTAVNLPPPVRVLVNLHAPDQRGTFVDVPGTLVDLVADPARDRFYVLRQDTNQVLVFDGSNYTQVATLKTYNSPTGMAITFDRRYLLVGHDSSQVAAVFDLETLQPTPYISTEAGAGNVAISIAASSNAILATAIDFTGKGHIIQLDLTTRRSIQLPSLGVYSNATLSATMAAAASPNGSSILFVSNDGNVFLYNASANTFTISRKLATGLAGAYAASSYDTYVAGNNLLNSSLVPVAQLDTTTGASSGFAFVDTTGYFTTTPGAASPGVIRKLDTSKGSKNLGATRMVESPITGTAAYPFTRTIAPLASRQSIINLTTSGFTVLPWAYDQAVAPPMLSRVVSAADGSSALAPGGLISIYGNNLSPVNLATKEIPVPTALGDSCLTVNGLPTPVLFVSPTQINAQLPFNVTGNVTMILRTPGGVSDNYNLQLQPGAPSIFRNSTVDPSVGDVATVVRASNSQLVTLSNPIHRGDSVVIYLTGLGQTYPLIDAGVPAPSDPLLPALISPTVTIAGFPVIVNFAGLSPGEVGVNQINVRVPGNVPTGADLPLLITQGSQATQVSVRVVE